MNPDIACYTDEWHRTAPDFVVYAPRVSGGPDEYADHVHVFPTHGGDLLCMWTQGAYEAAGNCHTVFARSGDGGVNWDEGTIIDYPASFNGQILEVEPDVVLVIYPESMGETRPSHVRAQLIRITPQGPVPLPSEVVGGKK